MAALDVSGAVKARAQASVATVRNFIEPLSDDIFVFSI